ncbi:MAG: hypothetical protein OXB92_17400 [Acidimicrobiaceae bacterium]|nr:hypothetical protein [Acidimicrobiaceae bacterium]
MKKKQIHLKRSDLTAERMREIQHETRTSIVDLATDCDVYFDIDNHSLPVTGLGLYRMFDYDGGSLMDSVCIPLEFRIYYKRGDVEFSEVVPSDVFGR